EWVQVFDREVLASKGRRLRREGLRRPGYLSWRIGSRHRPLFNEPERFARFAIEHPDETFFSRQRDDVDHLAIVADAQKHWRGRVVVVPNVVMDHLEVPDEFSGTRIECNQAVTKEVGPGSIGAVEIVFRACGRNEDHTAFLVQ